MILAVILIAMALFVLKTYFVMLTWGMLVDNVELFNSLTTFSFAEALYVTLFISVAFAFSLASGSKSSSNG